MAMPVDYNESTEIEPVVALLEPGQREQVL